LSGLQSLAELDLGRNPIIDFEPLYSLKKLTELHLDKTLINNAQIQALREVLPNCKIS
jgi:Leucine-rich repeat (LRR) protein